MLSLEIRFENVQEENKIMNDITQLILEIELDKLASLDSQSSIKSYQSYGNNLLYQSERSKIKRVES